MKTCRTCKLELAAESFHTDRTRSDGLTNQCRACGNEARRRRYRAHKQASAHNYGKEDVPENFSLSAVSQLVDADGNTKLTWLKAKADKPTREALEAMVLEICEPLRGKIPALQGPKSSEADLIKVIPIGDMHVGLRCNKDETGEDYDLAEAENNLVAAVDGLIESAPRTAESLIINVGDYLHSDNSWGATTKGTPLDTSSSSRFATLLVCIRMYRRIIDRCLTTSDKVTVITCTGNHDGESSIWLRIALQLAYENEPRVDIQTDPRKFHFHRFGKCLFGATHGDTCKLAQLPIIMALDRKEDWGQTQHRHWFTGHIHHGTLKETMKDMEGCSVESFRTLAAQDKWHQGQGYRSERDLQLQVWHKDYGLEQTFRFGIHRVWDRLLQESIATP